MKLMREEVRMCFSQVIEETSIEWTEANRILQEMTVMLTSLEEIKSMIATLGD